MKKIIAGSLLLFSLILLWAKDDPQKFRLVHSDKLYMSNLPTGQILELNGRVHFFYGDTEFKGDRALILDGPKIARLSGNVSVENDSLHLVADSLAYYRIPRVLNMGGRVQLTQDTKEGTTRWMQGDYGIYDQAKDTFTTWSRVRAYDQDENGYASCGYAFWDRAAGYAYLIEKPSITAGTTDTLTVSADKMEFFDGERKLIATFNVEVSSNEYRANSDFLIYFAEEEKAVFIGEPEFTNDFATANAQEFHLWFKERELRKAALMDSCRVHFSQEEGKPKDNWVQAKDIVINFASDRIEDFEATGEVSYYFLQEEKEKQDFFINSAVGQVLKAKFDADNKLKLMDMSGRIHGRYVFKNDS